jgi:hypothetical protein
MSEDAKLEIKKRNKEIVLFSNYKDEDLIPK